MQSFEFKLLFIQMNELIDMNFTRITRKYDLYWNRSKVINNLLIISSYNYY